MSSSPQPGHLLAITGMDTAWGGIENIEGFEQLVYEAAACLPAQPARPESLESKLGSILERVTRQALQDSGIDIDSGGANHRIAFISAVSSYGPNQPEPVYFQWNGLHYPLAENPHPLAAALDLAEQIIGEDRADAVVFAAAALNSGSGQAGAASGFGFDRSIHAPFPADGAGAVVMMHAQQAARLKVRIYALVQSRAFRIGNPGQGSDRENQPFSQLMPPAMDDVRSCCQEAIEISGQTADSIQYIEAFACGKDAIDGIEIAGLAQSYRMPDNDLRTAIGSGQANIGYLSAASGLAGLIRAALCLHHRMIPGVPNWSGPKLPALWRNAPFYVPTESRPWFKKTTSGGRFAAVSSIGKSGSYLHLILKEASETSLRSNRVLARGGFHLFPIAGDTQEGLQAMLVELQHELGQNENLFQLAANWNSKARQAGDSPYGLAIVGHNVDELLREVSLALKALPDVFTKSGEWQTPLGSYFTANPAGRLGGVALVYPGAFNTYPGVARDLFRLFPALYQRTARLTTDLGQVLRERMLYPRSLTPISKEEMAVFESRLLADPIAMLISGTSLSVMYTHLLQDIFSVQPISAFGYSLGENSMMYATNVWASHGDQAAARLETSPAFRNRLAGPQEAIREFWGMDPGETLSDQPLWSNYLVMAEPEKVEAALKKEPRVYLTHINTPRQVVMGGDPQACQRVLGELGCSSIKAPFDYAIHCEVMSSEYTELANLHCYPVENQVGLKMYSASDYQPLALNQTEISEKLAHMLTSPLDFPRLVKQVYQDGARIFIEAGAGSNCSRWIDEILKDRPSEETYPHLALSMNRRGTDDYHTFVRMLARLYCHRVPMDLSALYLPDQVLPKNENLYESWRVSP